jgi:ApaG protein
VCTIQQYIRSEGYPVGEQQFLRLCIQHRSLEQGLYLFAYTITISNTGTVAAQLISRTWNVNDANGHTEKVKGLGVVGQQPLLKPGQRFEYTSGTRLRTPTGTMHGSYFCVAEDGEKFDVDIPMFVLDALSSRGSADQRTLH